MKTNITLSVCVCFLLSIFSSSLFSQEKIVETQYYKNNPELGGDVVINNSTKEVKGERSYTHFEIQAKESGSYNLNFWLLPAQLKDGSYSNYEVLVNGVSSGKINPVKGNWQAISLNKGTKVTLKSGINTISVVTKVPEIAEVEFVRLSKDVSKAAISSLAYDEYLEKAQRGENDEEGLLRSTTANPGVALDAKANYIFYPNVTFHYTYYTTASFSAGQQVFISTESSTLHVVELFNYSNPDTYSWVNKSLPALRASTPGQLIVGGINYLGSINITIPISGTYIVRVRTATNGTAGVASVNVNGQNFYRNTPIHSTGFRVTQGGDGVAYNTFTTNLTGDSRLWLERGTAIPGKIVAWNDDWNESSDHNWGLNSRIRLGSDKSAVHGVQLSAYSASNPTGKCDLYVKCFDGAVYPSFSNLKQRDEIQSAPIDPTYNAFSWVAGINLFVFDPANPFSEYYVENDPLTTLHMFLLTPKYDNCPVFSTIGATQANSDIDVYGFYNLGNLSIKSASIKDGANNYPHGFARETKFGQNIRSFHPRSSLENGFYGNTVAYFRCVGTGILLAEAIADGTAVLQHVEFTTLENNIIAAQKAILTTTIKNTFNTKFSTWKATNNVNSTAVINNSEFNSLLNYSLANPGTAYLVYEKLGEGDFDASYLIDKLTLTSISNTAILDDVNEEGKQMRLRSANNINYVDTIVSPYVNAMKYTKRLLTGGGALLRSSTENTDNNEETGITGIKYSNEDKFNVVNNTSGISIDFFLKDNAKISLIVIDLKGRVIESLLQGQILTSGNYNYNVNLPEGIYLVKYVYNGNSNVKKVFRNK